MLERAPSNGCVLRRLDVTGCMQVLITAPPPPVFACRCVLRRLDVTGCDLDSAAAAHLAGALSPIRKRIGSARERAVSGDERRGGLDDAEEQQQQEEELCAVAPVRVLVLRRNAIGQRGAEAIASRLLSTTDWGPRRPGHHRSALERIDLSYNGLGDAGLCALAAALSSVGREEAAPALRELLVWPTLDPRRLDEGCDAPPGATSAAVDASASDRPTWPLKKSTLAKVRVAWLALWRCSQLKSG